MTRLSPRQRRNLRRRQPPPTIYWQHLLGFFLVVIPFGIWAHQLHRDGLCNQAATFERCQ